LIVLDASAGVELVLETAQGARVADRLRGETVHVPAHFDVEVVGVIRRYAARGELNERDAEIAFDHSQMLPLRRWEVRRLLRRAFDLRTTHATADALYLALAEALRSPLLTADARLARSSGHHATIELL
jgi:predicted nucleic acid-binding protein